MGVVVRRYIDIFPTPLVLYSSFFDSSIPTLFIFKMFFRSCFCYFFTIIYIANVTQNIQDRSKKSRSREYIDSTH